MAADGTARGRIVAGPPTPGWHPDPARRSHMRYRSEAGWTSHVLDWKGAPRLDALNGTSPAPDPGELRLMFLVGRPRRRATLIAGGVVTALGASVTLALGQPLVMGPALLVAAVLALLSVLMRNFGVVLDVRGITLRGWRTRRVTWPEVHRIESHHRWGARRVRVDLQRGTVLWTWAPYDDALAPDPKFDARVRALQQWHLDHFPAPAG